MGEGVDSFVAYERRSGLVWSKREGVGLFVAYEGRIGVGLVWSDMSKGVCSSGLIWGKEWARLVSYEGRRDTHNTRTSTTHVHNTRTDEHFSKLFCNITHTQVCTHAYTTSKNIYNHWLGSHTPTGTESFFLADYHLQFLNRYHFSKRRLTSYTQSKILNDSKWVSGRDQFVCLSLIQK